MEESNTPIFSTIQLNIVLRHVSAFIRTINRHINILSESTPTFKKHNKMFPLSDRDLSMAVLSYCENRKQNNNKITCLKTCLKCHPGFQI